MPSPISAASEDETERDGLFSYRAEIHAAIVGLAVGLVVGMTGSWELASLFVFVALGAKLASVKHEKLRDIRREPWYALGTFVVGLALSRAVWALSLI